MEPATIPWYKSQVLWGIGFSFVGKALALAFPKLGISDVQWVSAISYSVSFVGDAVAAHGRITSTAQPVTLTKNG